MRSSQEASWSPVLQNSLNVSNDDILLTIGHGLRAWYDDILQEGVPARFSTLTERIENAEGEPK